MPFGSVGDVGCVARIRARVDRGLRDEMAGAFWLKLRFRDAGCFRLANVRSGEIAGWPPEGRGHPWHVSWKKGSLDGVSLVGIRSSIDRRSPGLAGPRSLVGSSAGPGRVLPRSHRRRRHAALVELMAGIATHQKI